MGVAEALCQLRLQDLLQSALSQLVAAVAAPHVHPDSVALRARAARARAAGAEAVGGQVADLVDRRLISHGGIIQFIQSYSHSEEPNHTSDSHRTTLECMDCFTGQRLNPN